MDKIDFKKDFKKLYLPSQEPCIVEVPKMNFVSVMGHGDPNELDGEYQKSMKILYGITFTIKMSRLSNDQPDGYYDYVVPPLEGFWDIDLDKISDFGITDKSKFNWISMLRLPEYVTEEVFEWAKVKFKSKNPNIDYSNTKYLSFEEGLCAQIMHIGSYDNEKPSINKLTNYIHQNGYTEDFNENIYRYHHEIYLSDPRKTKLESLKTVIRHPIKKIGM
ncbi:MAG: GyrI-like domain-containing protein [Clostridia bacterium]|nr:GyrI-like domain-containing protein [Clostridia bacterium]